MARLAPQARWRSVSRHSVSPSPIVNGDGKPDLVVINGTSGSTVGQTVSVLLGNGNGTFQARTTYSTGTGPMRLAIRDLNGDGKLDLVVANGTNNVSVLLGNGDGTFRPQVTYCHRTHIRRRWHSST